MKIIRKSIGIDFEEYYKRANDYFNKRIDADGNACCELWNNYLNVEHE